MSAKNLMEEKLHGQLIIEKYDVHPIDTKYHGAKFELVIPKKEFY